MSSKAVEANIADAIDTWKRGEFLTKAACCRHFGVDYQIFVARLKGRGSRHTKRPPNHRLTYEEENAIVQFMCRLADLGVHGNTRTIETAANSLILKRSDVDSFEPVSKHWTKRFLAKHS